MPAKDAAARFPFDDTTTHMCVYNVRTRGKEERNRERERGEVDVQKPVL